jgi:hypothetical protein
MKQEKMDHYVQSPDEFLQRLSSSEFTQWLMDNPAPKDELPTVTIFHNGEVFVGPFSLGEVICSKDGVSLERMLEFDDVCLAEEDAVSLGKMLELKGIHLFKGEQVRDEDGTILELDYPFDLLHGNREINIVEVQCVDD